MVEEVKIDSENSGLKDYDGYQIINNVYTKYKISSFKEEEFEKIILSKDQIKAMIHDAMLEEYLKLTVAFEEKVKELNVKLDTLNLSDKRAKEEFKRLKKELDDLSELLENQDKVEENFKIIQSKAEKQFQRLTIDKILTGKAEMLFSIGKYEPLWLNGSSILTSTNHNGYWCEKSQMAFESSLTCRIKCLHFVGSHPEWNINIGLIRAESTNQGTYYQDGAFFMTCGRLTIPFQGSNGNSFLRALQIGDELIIKRDEQGNVLLALNDDEFKSAFTGIVGPMRIAIGFLSSRNGDSFEMLELGD